MITDRDIQRIKEAFKDTFVTKDDLKNFTTKEDLAAMEKRFEAKFATKDDLKQIQTKDDARESFDIIVDQMQTVVHVLGELSEKVSVIESKIDSMNIRLDKTNLKAEMALQQSRSN